MASEDDALASEVFRLDIDEEEDEATSAAARDPRIHDPEVWMDYWSEDAWDVWNSLCEMCQSKGALLDACTFPDFMRFCFERSSGHPPVG